MYVFCVCVGGGGSIGCWILKFILSVMYVLCFLMVLGQCLCISILRVDDS